MGKNRQDSSTCRSCEQPHQVSESTPLNAFEITLLTLCAVAFLLVNAWIFTSITADNRNESSIVSQNGEYLDISVLNLATYEDFRAVKGIGDSKAKAIVNYRQLLGGFTSTEQLMDISGISEKIYQEIIEHFYNEEQNNAPTE